MRKATEKDKEHLKTLEYVLNSGKLLLDRFGDCPMLFHTPSPEGLAYNVFCDTIQPMVKVNKKDALEICNFMIEEWKNLKTKIKEKL